MGPSVGSRSAFASAALFSSAMGRAAAMLVPLKCSSFAAGGPCFSKLQPAPLPEEWARHGATLVRSLTSTEPGVSIDDPRDLDPAVATRVFHLYLPVYFWCRQLVQEKGPPTSESAVGIGISAPQGCGKTTLVTFLQRLFSDDGIECAVCSIDDFYLTGAEQEQLAQEEPDNQLLQLRGNAGSHDLGLGTATLSALLRREADVPIPLYDKAARSGRGDRAPRANWPMQRKPADVVLLEGWMAGFSPLAGNDPLLDVNPGLPEVNRRLADYAAWHDLVSGWVVLGLSQLEHVFEWRMQAEQAMAAAGRPGMSDEQVRDFVDRYMPAYTAFLPGLYSAATGRGGVGGKPTFFVQVDGTRRPIPSGSY